MKTQIALIFSLFVALASFAQVDVITVDDISPNVATLDDILQVAGTGITTDGNFRGRIELRQSGVERGAKVVRPKVVEVEDDLISIQITTFTDPGLYDFHLLATGKEPVVVGGAVELLAPMLEITNVDPAVGTVGGVFTITGIGFGDKKPKIWLEQYGEDRPKKIVPKVLHYSDEEVIFELLNIVAFGPYNLFMERNAGRFKPADMLMHAVELEAPVLILDRVDADNGPPGAQVSIFGEGFSVGKPKVSFFQSGVDKPKKFSPKVLDVGDGEILIEITNPPSYGLFDVQVDIPGKYRLSDDIVGGFEVTGPDFGIGSVDPPTGSIGDGWMFDINGVGFDNGRPKVWLEQAGVDRPKKVVPKILNVTDGEIQCEVKSIPGFGLFDVFVEIPGRISLSDILEGGIEFEGPTFRIDAVDPPVSTIGGMVTVQGVGFSNGKPKVWFEQSGVDRPKKMVPKILNVADGEIELELKTIPGFGLFDVFVEIPGKIKLFADKDEALELEGPEVNITNVDPPVGSIGTIVTITGDGFTGKPKVTFEQSGEDRPKKFSPKIIAMTETELQVEIPTSIPGFFTFDVIVDIPGRYAVSDRAENAFELEGPVVEIDSVNPPEGTVGTIFTINGEGFTGRPKVTLLESGADRPQKIVPFLRSIEPNRLEAEIRTAKNIGLYDVMVEIPGRYKVSTTADAAFEVMVPDVEAVNPDVAEPGEEVSITGRFFGPKPTVIIGGQRTKVLEENSLLKSAAAADTELVVEVPSKLGNGFYDVTVQSKVGSTSVPAGLKVINSLVGVPKTRYIKATIDGKSYQVKDSPQLAAVYNGAANILIINSIIPATRLGAQLRQYNFALTIDLTAEMPILKTEANAGNTSMIYQESLLVLPPNDTQAKLFASEDGLPFQISFNSYTSQILSGVFSGTLRNPNDNSVIQVQDGEFSVQVVDGP